MFLNFNLRIIKIKKVRKPRKDMDMNLLKLKYFLIVAETGHLSNSANIIGISQPSLSAMITKLEKELGAALFERSGRNIKLTECGKAYEKYVKEAFLSLENGQQAINDIQNKQKTIINLACTCPRFTYSLVQRILPKMPNIRVKQAIVNDEEIPKFLNSHPNSYAISSPCSFNENIDCKQIFEEKLLVAVGAKSHLSSLSSIKLRDLKNEAFISLSEGSTLRLLCEKFCNLAGFHPNNIAECDHITRAELIAKNYGIAISTSLAASGEYIMPLIKYIPISDINCMRSIALFKQKNKHRSPLAIEFENHVAEVASELSNISAATYDQLYERKPE